MARNSSQSSAAHRCFFSLALSFSISLCVCECQPFLSTPHLARFLTSPAPHLTLSHFCRFHICVCLNCSHPPLGVFLLIFLLFLFPIARSLSRSPLVSCLFPPLAHFVNSSLSVGLLSPCTLPDEPCRALGPVLGYAVAAMLFSVALLSSSFFCWSSRAPLRLPPRRRLRHSALHLLQRRPPHRAHLQCR